MVDGHEQNFWLASRESTCASGSRLLDELTAARHASGSRARACADPCRRLPDPRQGPERPSTAPDRCRTRTARGCPWSKSLPGMSCPSLALVVAIRPRCGAAISARASTAPLASGFAVPLHILGGNSRHSWVKVFSCAAFATSHQMPRQLSRVVPSRRSRRTGPAPAEPPLRSGGTRSCTH